MKNRALVFIKPHAITDRFIQFVETFLTDHQIFLSEPRRIGAQEVKKMIRESSGEDPAMISEGEGDTKKGVWSE